MPDSRRRRRWVTIPPQEAIERRLDHAEGGGRVQVPFDYDPDRHQSVRRYFLRLDASRLLRSDRRLVTRPARAGAPGHQGRPQCRWPAQLRAALAAVLRGGATGEAEDTAWEPWEVTAVVALDRWDAPQGPAEVLAVLPGDQVDRNFGAAVDIGTTTVTVWLVDLESRRGGGASGGLQRADRPRRGRHLAHHLRKEAGATRRAAGLLVRHDQPAA
jgi:hypothetical protein